MTITVHNADASAARSAVERLANTAAVLSEGMEAHMTKNAKRGDDYRSRRWQEAMRRTLAAEDALRKAAYQLERLERVQQPAPSQ